MSTASEDSISIVPGYVLQVQGAADGRYDNGTVIFTIGIICAGYDAVDGGSVYSIPLGGMCVRQPYAIGGSGSTYIYGFCDANFKPNMQRDDCLNFVKQGMCIIYMYITYSRDIGHDKRRQQWWPNQIRCDNEGWSRTLHDTWR